VYLSHGAITLSYLAWLLWPIVPSDGYGDEKSESHVTAWNVPKAFLFGLIVLLDITHDMSAIANRVSLERDWVPLLVGPITPDVTYGLTQVNAVMKRLDLASKLVAPSILPLIIAVFNFREGWILLLAGSTILFLIIQIRSMYVVARENPELQVLKKTSTGVSSDESYALDGQQHVHFKPGFGSWPRRIYVVMFKNPIARLRHYFLTPIWPASIAEALAQMTVLAYSSTLVTYLLEVGFSLNVVTIARASGTIMALSSTVIGPMAVNLVRKRKSHQSLDRNTAGYDIEGAVVRTVGVWGITSQVLCMVSITIVFSHFLLANILCQIPVVLVLWNLSLNPTGPAPESRDKSSDPTSSIPPPSILLSLILFTFLSLSRIGHLLFELMVQEIAQVEIPSTQRSTFAGTEQSFRSFFELCHWGATMIWSAPKDFRFLALGSLVALTSSATLFALWSRRPRIGVNIGYEEVPLDEIEAHAD
jgi:iron-regulated transporter 1